MEVAIVSLGQQHGSGAGGDGGARQAKAVPVLLGEQPRLTVIVNSDCDVFSLQRGLCLLGDACKLSHSAGSTSDADATLEEDASHERNLETASPPPTSMAPTPVFDDPGAVSHVPAARPPSRPPPGIPAPSNRVVSSLAPPEPKIPPPPPPSGPPKANFDFLETVMPTAREDLRRVTPAPLVAPAPSVLETGARPKTVAETRKSTVWKDPNTPAPQTRDAPSKNETLMERLRAKAAAARATRSKMGGISNVLTKVPAVQAYLPPSLSSSAEATALGEPSERFGATSLRHQQHEEIVDHPGAAALPAVNAGRDSLRDPFLLNGQLGVPQDLGAAGRGGGGLYTAFDHYSSRLEGIGPEQERALRRQERGGGLPGQVYKEEQILQHFDRPQSPSLFQQQQNQIPSLFQQQLQQKQEQQQIPSLFQQQEQQQRAEYAITQNMLQNPAHRLAELVGGGPHFQDQQIVLPPSSMGRGQNAAGAGVGGVFGRQQLPPRAPLRKPGLAALKTLSKNFFCHQCKQDIPYVRPGMICPFCLGDFLEESTSVERAADAPPEEHTSAYPIVSELEASWTKSS